MTQGENEGKIIPSPRRELATCGGSLARKGLQLAVDLAVRRANAPNVRAMDSCGQSYHLHRAMVAFTAHGVKEYFANWRQDFPDIEIDEHFLFVFAAYAAGMSRSDPTFRQNLADYLLEPKRFTRPELLPFQDDLRRAELLPDTSFAAIRRDWEKHEGRAISTESTDTTLAHFLRGLTIFVRWHNTRTELPAEVSETLAGLDPFNVGYSTSDRATLCAISAAYAASWNSGDFERYLIRNAIKNLERGQTAEVLEATNFLAHWHNAWVKPGTPGRENGKFRLIAEIAAKAHAYLESAE